MASGWETEGPEFKPQWLQATFDPRLPKKPNDSQPKQCLSWEKNFARRTLKDLKKYVCLFSQFVDQFLLNIHLK